MVGVTLLLVLLVVVADACVIGGRLERRGVAVAAGLSLLIAALMVWQLATEPAGLGRLGWTSVGVEAGRFGQALAVTLIGLLLLAAGMQLPKGQPVRWPSATRLWPSLGLIGALGSATIAFTCFVE